MHKFGRAFINFFSIENFFKNSMDKSSQIPGPLSLPIIGTLWNYIPILGEYSFQKLDRNGFKKFEKYGPVVNEEFTPGTKTIWLTDPDDFQAMFQAEGRYPKRRSHLALEKFRRDRKHIYNSAGLLPTNGLEWYRLRTAVQKKINHPENIKQYIEPTNEVVDEFGDYIKCLYLNREIPDCFLSLLSRLFLELTCLVVFDERLHSFSGNELKTDSVSSMLMKAAFDTNCSILETDNSLQLWRYYDTKKYKKLKESQLYMESVAMNFISKKLNKINRGKLNEKQTQSVLEQLINSPELDPKDIIGIACDLLLAGIDTTSYTMSFILYHVSRNHPVQNRLYDEVSTLLPDDKSHITSDILQKATYSRCVIKETLRMNPVSIGVGRILEKDTIFSNYYIPAGTVCVTQNQVACQLSKYFNDADQFIPERWLRGSPQYKPCHPYLVLPFGHGPRSCVARRLAEQSMMIILMKIIQQFHLTWQGDEKLETKSFLINKPDGNISIFFRPRKFSHLSENNT